MCHLFIGGYPESLHRTQPTLVSDDYTPQRVGHALLLGPTAPLVTELLQLPVTGYGTVYCGTVYCHISEMLTYRTVSSGGH